jgi:glycosyltransferase involved in cell wall biosynthesis
MITVIIPTYKSPEALDLCLQSIKETQTEKNQIIVVVDGYYELNREVLQKHADIIEVLNLPENVGLCRGTNLGVLNARFEKVLIVNDDNVFPYNWDIILNKYDLTNTVITPNQIEPYPSMFKQFHIRDLGKTIEDFSLKQFWQYEAKISENKSDNAGSTLPIFMLKQDYLRVGGWDENYPLGVVADWDFFLKCNLSMMEFKRIYDCHFYHFVSLSTNNTEERKESRRNAERYGHEYAKQKWGGYIQHDVDTNDKFINK